MDIRFIYMLLLLIWAVVNDYKNRTIKNVIPLCMAVSGILLNFYYKDINLLFSLLLSVVYFIFLFFVPRLFHINEFMGAGDIKLYMAISFLMGWKFSFYSFVYSVLIGAVILCILNLRRLKEIGFNVTMFFLRRGKWTMDEAEEKTNMFTPYILIGCVLEYFLQSNWLF